MMDMLTIYIIVALFIIIPFAVPFIVISIVNRSGKSSSAPLPPGVQAYRNTAPPRMYAAPYPPRAAYPVPGQTMNAPRKEKNDMTVSNVLFLIGTIFVVLSGLAFGVALSLVVMAGAELFTGNNFVMAAGMLKKKITAKEAVMLWIVCWIGNLAGAVILAVLYHLTGLGAGTTGAFMASGALAKMTAGPVQLITRGLLCNFLVCLAVWCGTKMKSESGKLIMIFWCLFAFITTGFEHSIANMTLLTEALLNPAGQAVTMAGYWYNLILVTIGNMIGGILFVAVPYYAASRS